jgi:hypothetical protein
MRRTALRLVIAVGLLGTGRIAAKAQTQTPTFELRVDAPDGKTMIQCIRGCKLAWVERGLNPNSVPIATFEYGCSGATRCQSGTVGGWVE